MTAAQPLVIDAAHVEIVAVPPAAPGRPEDVALRLGPWSWTILTDAPDRVEPRIQDLDAAVRLGFGRPRKIRELIERTWPKDRLPYCRPTVGRQLTNGGGTRTFEVKEYWLTEPQLLKLIARCRTPIAEAILDEMIAVYMAVKDRIALEQRKLQDRAPSLPAETPTQVHDRVHQAVRPHAQRFAAAFAELYARDLAARARRDAALAPDELADAELVGVAAGAAGMLHVLKEWEGRLAKLRDDAFALRDARIDAAAIDVDANMYDLALTYSEADQICGRACCGALDAGLTQGEWVLRVLDTQDALDDVGLTHPVLERLYELLAAPASAAGVTPGALLTRICEAWLADQAAPRPTAPTTVREGTLLEFGRGERSVLRLEFKRYNGRQFVGFREWVRSAGGGWYPTRRGVTIRLGELGAVARVLADLAARLGPPAANDGGSR